MTALPIACMAVVAIWLWREKRRDDSWGLALVDVGQAGKVIAWIGMATAVGDDAVLIRGLK